MDLVYFTGTRRCREPARTLELIAPLLGRFGITRLADITGLDFLGVPVAQAVRPGAATVTVSQGKGATRAAAMVSAAMEAIELSCAENAVPPARPDLSRRGPRAGIPARGPGHGAGQPGHGPHGAGLDSRHAARCPAPGSWSPATWSGWASGPAATGGSP